MRRLLLALTIGVFACGPKSDGTRPATPAASASTTTSTGTSTTQSPASADDAAIDKAAKQYLDLLVELYPENATFLGIHTQDGELNPYVIASLDKAIDREAKLLEDLKGVSTEKASKSARTDLELVRGQIELDVRTARVERPLQRNPTMYCKPMEVIFAMTAREYAPAAERAKNVLARVEKIPKTVETGKAQLLNPPEQWTRVAIEQAGGAKSFFDEQRGFLEKALPDQKPRIDAALKGATAAYEDYKKYLQKEVLPRSNGRFNAGRDHFGFLLQRGAFLTESPEELLAMGKKIFGETQTQLTELAKKIDPSAKGWPEVIAKLKGHHPPPEGVLDAFRKEVTRARGFVVAKDAFELPPGDELEVADTPIFLRSTFTASYDQAPPFDENVNKGFFFVTPVDKSLPKAEQEKMLREVDTSGMADTVVHETYPGHHLQISFARRNKSLARRFIDHSVFVEGWGLYSEEVMYELGFFDDEQRLFQLEWTLVRAARVVIDVSMHTGDMTFEAAVKMLTDDVHLEKPLAMSEVRRYSMNPTQPLSYLVGRQKIMELREKAKQKPGFSLKKFHTDLLSRGGVPPTLLAREMLE